MKELSNSSHDSHKVFPEEKCCVICFLCHFEMLQKIGLHVSIHLKTKKKTESKNALKITKYKLGYEYYWSILANQYYCCWLLLKNAVKISKSNEYHPESPLILKPCLIPINFWTNASAICFNCILLSCHVRVSEWIHTLKFAWMSRNSLLEAGAISEV